MPGTGAASSYGDLLVMSLVVLGGVCVAAFLLVRLVGRFVATGRTRGAHLLDVVARVPLEPRRSLYVVEVAGKTLLVGTSEMGLSVLSELDGAEVRSRTVARPSFGDLVRSAWDRRRAPPGGAEASVVDGGVVDGSVVEGSVVARVPPGVKPSAVVDIAPERVESSAASGVGTAAERAQSRKTNVVDGSAERVEPSAPREEP